MLTNAPEEKSLSGIQAGIHPVQQRRHSAFDTLDCPQSSPEH